MQIKSVEYSTKYLKLFFAKVKVIGDMEIMSNQHRLKETET